MPFGKRQFAGWVRKQVDLANKVQPNYMNSASNNYKLTFIFVLHKLTHNPKESYMAQENKLNEVNKRLLLSVLDPKRHDIVVTKKDGHGSKEQNLNRDGIVVHGIQTWNVKNTQKQEIYSLKRENIERPDGRFASSDFRLTLTITNVATIQEDTGYQNDFDTMCFLDRDLPQALDAKIAAQHAEEKLQNDLKRMTSQDIAIKKYLEAMLQK